MKNWFKEHIHINTFDASIASVFLSLYIILNLSVFKIRIPGMTTGFQYIILILMSLILKPVVSIIISICSDSLSSLINGSVWAWQYAIIPPMIVSIVLISKMFFNMKDSKKWIFINILLQVIICLTALLIPIIYKNEFPTTKSINKEDIKIWVYSSIALLIIIFSMLWVYYKASKNPNKRTVVNIFNTILLVIVIVIWIWGPIAASKFFEIKDFGVLFIPRLIKTPFVLAIYMMVIFPAYKILIKIKKNKYGY